MNENIVLEESFKWPFIQHTELHILLFDRCPILLFDNNQKIEDQIYLGKFSVLNYVSFLKVSYKFEREPI